MKEMPIDESNVKEIESYFSRLEKAICNNEPIEQDQFPPPDEESDNGSRVYKYYPSVDPSKLESGHHVPRGGQDVGHRESKSEVVSPAKDKPPAT